MNAANPYAPSPASLKAKNQPLETETGGVWRDVNELVMTHDAVLPARCVKCNEDAVEPLKKRKIYWHHPGIYALILINLILYFIVGLVVRKKAVVAPGLCRQHLNRRRWSIAGGWLSVVAGCVVMVIGGRNDNPLLIFAGLFGMLATIIVCMILARIVYAKRIDKEYVRLKGCGAEFLDSLPPIP
jgi:hypothetical protein